MYCRYEIKVKAAVAGYGLGGCLVRCEAGDFIQKYTKQLLKWLLVIAILVIIVYTFRDSAGPILAQLKATAPTVVIGICVMAMVYHLLEGLITTVLARQYVPDFTLRQGVTNALLCSFYRVATLGSGAGIAALVYLGDQGVSYGESFGLYMMQYALHKSGIAVFSLIFYLASCSFMNRYFAQYQWLLLAGYGITAVITLCLVLFACSRRFHYVAQRLLEWVNRKCRGKLAGQLQQLEEQCAMLEASTDRLLKRPRILLAVMAINLVKFCFFYGIPYLSFAGTGEIGFLKTLAITSLSVMLAAVLPAPAGIGSTEFVFTGLASQIVGMDTAGAVALLYRFGTFVFPFLVGGIVVVIRRVQKRRKHRQ